MGAGLDPHGRGLVAVDWRKTDSGLTMEVAVPANATAMVSVPAADGGMTEIAESGRVVWKNGVFAEGVDGIRAGKADGDFVTFEVGSGEYTFQG